MLQIKRERLFSELLPITYRLVGSFVITAGWNWYHLAHRPHSRFIYISLATWAVVCAAYHIGKWIFLFLLKRFNRHHFWHTEFNRSLDLLFFSFSFLFLVFFSRSEWLSIAYVSILLLGLYFVFDRELKKHPYAIEWRRVNRAVFALFFFLFILNSILQFAGYNYYIFDPQRKTRNIVFFRAWSMTMVWMIVFAFASLAYWRFKSWLKYVSVGLWTILLAFVMFVWLTNIDVLYFSGLYFSPVALEHREGGGAVIWNYLTYFLLVCYAVSIGALIWLMRHTLKTKLATRRRSWHYYNFAIIAVGLLSIFGFSSIQSTPELAIAKSFYNYYLGNSPKIELEPATVSKLKKFGLSYNFDNFKIAHKEFAWRGSQVLLPEKFKTNRPNVIVIFLESFSSRFVNGYNDKFKNLTPGLKQMYDDPNTTVIKKYYNASTPTITGLIAQLCSFLPPTGHEEFYRDKKLKSLKLFCFPRALKDAGYKYTGYITAVEKNFANKDTVFASMGTDDVYGTEELSEWITGQPLAWGYSDHQMFPAMMDIIRKRAAEPFLMMLSTVDSHIPFITAKDLIRYSRNDALSSFHTTDDAFRIFWDDFRSTNYANNTIVVAVADHAVFPAAITKDIFPEEVGKVNFYDETAFMVYVPDNVLPKEVDLYSSSIDFAPTLLHLLGINPPNSFEGHSIFDDRNKYPNLLGMHEFGLYINEDAGANGRETSYAVPSQLECSSNSTPSTTLLTLCEFKQYFQWKRQMFEEGRFWEQ